MGSKDLRNVLYMSALVGKNSCKVYKPFVDRLKEKGKKPKVIVVTMMHKILRIVFAILKKVVPFAEAPLFLYRFFRTFYFVMCILYDPIHQQKRV